MNLRKLLLTVTTSVCCVLLLQSCIKEDGERAVEEYVKVGDAVPSFSVTASLGGASKLFTQASFIGKSSLIVLFTAECPNCQALMPHVDRAWQVVSGSSSYQIIPVARESLKSAVDALWSANGMTMPYYLDLDRSAYNKFANRDVPRLYYVNEQGIIEWMQTGETGMTKDVMLDILGYPQI